MATGAVWFDVILPKTDNVDVRTVVFSPNRRTIWREHEHGRLLQITSGYGFLCREGGFLRSVVVRATQALIDHASTCG